MIQRNEWRKIYADLKRYNRKDGFIDLILTAIRKKGFRHILYFRWYQSGFMQPIRFFRQMRR